MKHQSLRFRVVVKVRLYRYGGQSVIKWVDIPNFHILKGGKEGVITPRWRGCRGVEV
ncbi:MAG: hypothetical protein MRJ65_10225 [Candidatus Brocadiaceae bacterium]|nr:hypothetical protein [Candidatus Brocadiaceae bacterium]